MGLNRVKTSGPVETFTDVTLYGGVPPTRTTYTTDPYLTKYYYKVSKGRNIPDFHKRKARGELLPLTEWYQWEAEGEAGGDLTIRKPSTGFIHWFEPYGSYAFIPGWLITTGELKALSEDLIPSGPDYDKYLTAAAARIYSSGWDALTFLAEFGKTIGMFRGLSKRTIDQMRSGRVDEKWLESRYGWRLLIYDIKDIIKAINSLDEHRLRYRESVGHTESSTSQWTHAYYSELYNSLTTFTDVVEVGARGTVVADIEPPKVSLNPVTTAWELIPYSFVADWFVNVGKYLESMSFLALSQKHYAAAGYRATATRSGSSEVTWTHSQWVVDEYSFDSYSASEVTVRNPASVPLSPSIDVNLNAEKLADLGALTSQAMLRRWPYLKEYFRRYLGVG